MPLYNYTAKASPDKVVRGEMYAQNTSALSDRLIGMGLHPLDIVPAEEEQGLPHRWWRRFLRAPARADLIRFTRQLATLVGAGVTVHGGLELLSKQYAQSPMGRVLEGILERVRDGQRLSEACSAWPEVFSEFYVNMIRAGEAGGMLELVLDHLADFLEKEDEVRKQIQAALAYPVLMLIIGMITVTVLLTFVVPRIVDMFQEMGQQLPLPTRMLIGVSHLVTHWWWLLLILLVGGVALGKTRLSQPAFRRRVDGWKLKLPFFGGLIVQGEITQFARTLSALLSHGVPVHRAFEVVMAACKNSVIREEFRQAGEAIRKGARIGRSLQAGKHFPDMTARMLSIAEETNQLETVLERIARSGSREIERRVAIFTRLLEPAMIILIGGIIGFIVFAMMMPIFQIDFVVQ
ncbi:MAG: type II secretion system F family protein [Calditrichaeota bacterium]|nr:MAG: type II secretion system F family protein [Calditrichota bacterium]